METVSLCMICKNEEKLLPFALESVKDLVSEIIINDTGSTDRTVEVAEHYGAFVINTGWTRNFSFHRNLSTVNANSDWILWLDGDEVFCRKEILKIKAFLKSSEQKKYDFLAMPRYNFWHNTSNVFGYPDTQYKMYRNRIGLRWHDPIHEWVFNKNSKDHQSRVHYSDIHVFHYAYMKTDDEVANKMANYIKIENPHMKDEEIKKCSKEHSFFLGGHNPSVQPYFGSYPEVFSELEVIPDSGIFKITGEPIYKFDEKKKNIVEKLEVTDPKLINENRSLNQEINQLKDKVTDLRNEINLSNREKSLVVVGGNNDKDVYLSSDVNITDTEVPFRIPENPAIKVSVVIAACKQPNLLKNCIHSIYPNVHEPFEIIVVKNCDDQNHKMVSICNELEETFENLKVLDLKENKGFSRGYNAGIRETQGKYILALNDDTEFLSNNVFKNCIDVINENNRCGLVACRSNNMSGEGQNIPELAGKSLEECKQIYSQYLEEKSLESSWVTGCFMFIERRVIEALYGQGLGLMFDEQFLTGEHEDTDLIWRLQHKLKGFKENNNDTLLGGKVYVANNVCVYHHGSMTLNEIPNRDKINSENKMRLVRKWPEFFPEGVSSEL